MFFLRVNNINIFVVFELNNTPFPDLLILFQCPFAQSPPGLEILSFRIRPDSSFKVFPMFNGRLKVYS